MRQFGYLAKASNTIVIPANTADIAGMVASSMAVFEQMKEGDGAPTPPRRQTPGSAKPSRDREV